MNNVAKWAQVNGFSFAIGNTFSIHFHRKRNLQPPPQLYLEDRSIKARNSVKFLGMVLDERLKWKDHIGQLKIDCMKRLNLINYLPHRS